MKRILLAAVLVLGVIGFGAGVASAGAASAASARPAVALSCPANTLCVYNQAGVNTEGWGCSPLTDTHPAKPIWTVNNRCSVRVWFHQNANNSGWAICFPPNTELSPLPQYRNPGNIQITTNHSTCT